MTGPAASRSRRPSFVMIDPYLMLPRYRGKLSGGAGEAKKTSFAGIKLVPKTLCQGAIVVLCMAAEAASLWIEADASLICRLPPFMIRLRAPARSFRGRGADEKLASGQRHETRIRPHIRGRQSAAELWRAVFRFPYSEDGVRR